MANDTNDSTSSIEQCGSYFKPHAVGEEVQKGALLQATGKDLFLA